MAYSQQTITAITDIPALAAAFAVANGWTVNSSTPTQPVFTLPTADTLGTWRLSASISGYDHTLTWTTVSSAVPTSTANTTSPKLAPTSGTNPVVPTPTKLHMFISPAPATNPYLAIVIEYNTNLFRHLYLGRMERLGDYSNGEIVAGMTGPMTSYSATVGYQDYNCVQYLFQSRSAARANTACGGVRVTHADNANEWRKFLGYNTGSVTSLPANCVLGGYGDAVNDGYVARGEVPYAGINALVSINLYNAKPITSEMSLIPIGRPPGIRHVNMRNLGPGDSINVGGVQWRVFPAMAKSSETAMPPGLGNWRSYETSYYNGYAYREN